MKILQVAKKVPYRDGESLAILALAQSLKLNACQVHLISLNTRKHAFPGDSSHPSFESFCEICWADADTGLKAIDLLWALKGIPIQIARFYRHPLEILLQRHLEKNDYDFILVETIYLLPYIPLIRRYFSGKIILRTHNMEFEIWQRLAQGLDRGWKKWLFGFVSRQLAQYEKTKAGVVDAIWAISDREAVFFGKCYPHLPIRTVPITWYFADKDNVELPSHLSLCFLGSLDWKPNMDGLRWFLSKVWPLLHHHFPGLSLFVAGKNMPQHLKESKVPGVHMVGEVDQSTPFLCQHTVFVAPLLSGSGMRAKLIEAAALGRVIVATGMALEGAGFRKDEEVLLADTPEEFLEALYRLVNHPDLVLNLGQKAREAVRKHFNSQSLGADLVGWLNLQ